MKIKFLVILIYLLVSFSCSEKNNAHKVKEMVKENLMKLESIKNRDVDIQIDTLKIPFLKHSILLASPTWMPKIFFFYFFEQNQNIYEVNNPVKNQFNSNYLPKLINFSTVDTVDHYLKFLEFIISAESNNSKRIIQTVSDIPGDSSKKKLIVLIKPLSYEETKESKIFGLTTWGIFSGNIESYEIEIREDKFSIKKNLLYEHAGEFTNIIL